jgi:hypothetical protein
MNWLRVLGTAELPHIDQGVCYQLHAKMSWLHMFKPQEESLEFALPRKGSIDARPQGMNGGIEEPFAPSLGALAVARILLNVGDHASIENALTIVRGIKASVEIQIGSSQVQTDRFGHPLQSVQTIGQQDHVRLVDWSYREWRQHIAVVVGYSDDFLPFLVFVARVANPIAPFLATALVPSPCSTRRSSFFSSARWATLAMNACSSDPSSAHLGLLPRTCEILR